MAERTIVCHHCSAVWSYTPPLPRRAECPKCRRDAHACHNCKHFDPGAHHECREEQAEWVKDKDRSNFCSYFEPGGRQSRGGEAAAAKAKLAGLFAGQTPAEAPKGQGIAEQLAKFLEAKK